MIRGLARVLICSLLAVGAVHAANVEGLFTAVVPVADRSEAEFGRGLANALAAVLVKLTGDSGTPAKAAARRLIGRAKQYMTVFGYEQGADGALWLRADFDPHALGSALREHGLVIWGKERPQTLVWLVITGASGRYLAPTELYEPLFAALDRAAHARGIPLLKPVIDGATQALLAAAASDEALTTALLAASEPYGAQSVLIGRLTQASDLGWQSTWRLHLAGEDLDWDSQGELPEPLVVGGVALLADALGRRFATPGSSSGESSVELTVQGIATPDDYGRALAYLRAFDAVTKLGVRRVTGTTVVFQVTAHGGMTALAQAIGFGSVMTEVAATPGTYALNPQ